MPNLVDICVLVNFIVSSVFINIYIHITTCMIKVIVYIYREGTCYFNAIFVLKISSGLSDFFLGSFLHLDEVIYQHSKIW